jgi:uncharacterized membrane protein
MSDLVVLAFEGAAMAEGVLDTIDELADRGVLEIEDAVIASRPAASERMVTNLAGSGGMVGHVLTPNPEVQITQKTQSRGRTAALGGGIGLLAGWLFGGPVGGAAVGAVIGALRDKGIDDGFIREVSEQLPADSSAVFLLVKRADVDQALTALAPYKGRVLHTTIAPELETALRRTLQSEG